MSAGRAETRRLIKKLEKQGFTVERTGGGHWRVRKEGTNSTVVMGFSPSGTGQHKTLKRLEEMGYQR